MIFNEYPYTDFHELNMDELIKLVIDLLKRVEDLEKRYADENK